MESPASRGYADLNFDELGPYAAGPPVEGREIEAYAIAAASRSATSREPFRDAKSKVIERFERAYISAALGRHAGNIAMAARAAQKHRRAFWALMRKHDIDAGPFRAQAAPPGSIETVSGDYSAPALDGAQGAANAVAGIGDRYQSERGSPAP